MDQYLPTNKKGRLCTKNESPKEPTTTKKCGFKKCMDLNPDIDIKVDFTDPIPVKNSSSELVNVRKFSIWAWH